MPKRTDIKSICIIGAGPIVIGQACEFDYSGAQACKALRAEGYRVILINSNPATIMTDPNLADATYIEPITPAIVAKILEKEKPDALLPTMGGQTALNTAMALDKDGTLKRLNIELIGAKKDAIEKAEDRQLFRDAMDKIGLTSPKSRVVKNLAEGQAALAEIGLPAIIRPSFTLAGTGGGIAYNKQQYNDIVASGLDASPVTEVLVEESVLGWKEYEMEVVRDKADNCIIICAIENVDPMGIHTGDSITVAPALTLTDKEYQIMRNASIAVLREIGVDTGGSNVQFAVNPADGRMVVIEMNPRVSRSSALASKATGFPIAKIAAKLAVGYTLDELKNDMTQVTPASFEPTIDYVVTKIPRFAFEKFPGCDPLLTTAMKSVGEVMAVGRSWQESVQKALRSMETGLHGFNDVNLPGADKDPLVLREALGKPTHDRLLVIAQAMRHGMSVADIHAICKVDPWFLEQIKGIIDTESAIKKNGLPKSADELMRLKQMGFADARLATLTGKSKEEIASLRHALNVRPVYKRIDTCGGEFASATAYMYSSYEGIGAESEARVSDKKKVIILGGGPNRIGQGIEFDYCCVHAVFALREAGIETIMINCNPETVSTDYDTSDRLYFEPLTAEDVIEIVRIEQSKGHVLGVIVQFGGQTPLKLADELQAANIPILGTQPDKIDLTEDRERFQKFLEDLAVRYPDSGIRQPESGIAFSEDQVATVSAAVSQNSEFSILMRPSYVLGGRGMKIIPSGDQVTFNLEVTKYATEAVKVSDKNPVLIDRYLSDATEVDVDVICDGDTVYIAGVMEHIEEAGIHSGDSACSLPPYSLSQKLIDEMGRQAELMAKEIGVIGLMNVQFAVKDQNIYVLEVNPRASRTVPFVAKATGVAVAKIAARVMAGEKLASFKLKPPVYKHVAVKEAVFPFSRFPGVDVLLGPEMKSTGEVMGIDVDFPKAFAKSQLGAGVNLPLKGNVFISVRDRDKPSVIAIATQLISMGFGIVATSGTAKTLQEKGLKVTSINKVLEGSPHIVDAMINGDIQLVMNTTEGAKALADSFSLRQTALLNKIPYYTTVAEASAVVQGIAALQAGNMQFEPIQNYFKVA
ncbi:MAG: carbamoyl-phosphate synthase large subunit [Alphaproteobacteria bacterium]|nr:carbamoyl-phosphate synthase large subunit [Alphaproteobacteria bacterium]